MRIVPFEAHHLADIEPQEGQQFISPHRGNGRALEAMGEAYTALEGGDVVGCSGLVEIWPERAIAWAVLSETGPRNFLRIHRIVRRSVEESEIRRIEIYVRSDDDKAHRWARLLGFEKECGPLRQFDPDGNDYDIYVRFNG